MLQNLKSRSIIRNQAACAADGKRDLWVGVAEVHTSDDWYCPKGPLRNNFLS
jgi:hypothetical protein